MLLRNFYLVNLLIILHDGTQVLGYGTCDHARHSFSHEGNLGEIAKFPWLGVLRVHLHEGGMLKVALTGLVLVKGKYAIASADDIVKVPKRILKDDSKVMFILDDGVQWFCKVKDYMAHPEYEYSTYNTIALLELEVDEGEEFSATPVCWPPKHLNTSNHLYALGYTDEKQLLEKFVYKLQYVERTLCEEFYNRAGFVDQQRTTPTNYLCGFAANNKENCVWDNGMALISNASGNWVLLGLGIHGPGCAAPSRFLDMAHYLPWVDSATSLIPDDYRRSGKKRIEGDFDAIPAHTLFKSNLRTDGQTPKIENMFFDTYSNEYFYIDRLENDTMGITFDSKYEANEYACEKYKKLVYHEEMQISTSAQRSSTVTLKLALYDLTVRNYTCVLLKVEGHNRSPALLWYKFSLETGGDIFGETPEEIIRPYPLPIDVTYAPPSETGQTYWATNPNLRPIFIKDTTFKRDFPYIEIFVKFKYYSKGMLNLKVFGPGRIAKKTTEGKKRNSTKLTTNMLRTRRFKKKK